MTCKTPDFSVVLAQSNNSKILSPKVGEFDYGFILDGVMMYRNFGKMTVYLDPKYFMFEEEGSIKEVQFGDRTMITIQVHKVLCKFS